MFKVFVVNIICKHTIYNTFMLFSIAQKIFYYLFLLLEVFDLFLSFFLPSPMVQHITCFFFSFFKFNWYIYIYIYFVTGLLCIGRERENINFQFNIQTMKIIQISTFFFVIHWPTWSKFPILNYYDTNFSLFCVILI